MLGSLLPGSRRGRLLVGGALILAGAGTRWIAAALIPVLLGATWAHAGNGWMFTAPNGGWEYPAFLAVAALTQALLGDGKFAVSALISRSESTGANALNFAGRRAWS